MFQPDPLIAKALLAGNRHGNRLTQLDQIRLHVSNRLVENLDRILHAADSSIGIGADQATQPIKEAHCTVRILAEVSENTPPDLLNVW